MGKKYLCQQTVQPDKSFKVRTMKEGESDQQSSEEVVDGVNKQRVWDDVNRKDLVTNKTELKWGHLKHIHINKEMSMEQHYVETSHTFFGKSACQGASLMCQYTNASTTGHSRRN